LVTNGKIGWVGRPNLKAHPGGRPYPGQNLSGNFNHTHGAAFNSLLDIILVFSILVGGLLTVLGFFGKSFWIFELASHFRVQYFIVLLTASIVLFIIKLPYFAALGTLFALINFLSIAPLYSRLNRKDERVSSGRLFLANVLQKNQNRLEIGEQIVSTNPDIVALIEINQSWWDDLEIIRSKYQYTEICLREDNYGIALLSRIPFINSSVMYFGAADVPSLHAKIHWDGIFLNFLVTHPPPPKGKKGFQFRNDQLKALTGFIDKLEEETIICGDLNMSYWSPAFSEFINSTQLVNSSSGFGIQPTWPVKYPILQVPIDHFLVSEGIRVLSRFRGHKFGSDHFPVIMDFCIIGK
jgi:endonuclease/exonuclease/phosphatase (EEP) superfamily protein YafD